MDIFLPRHPAAFYILLTLLDGPSHGYGIMQATRDRSNGAIRLGPGSFYRHLAKLLNQSMVTEASGPRDDDPRRGAYYRITPRGRQALAAERERLADLVAALDTLGPVSRRGTP